MAWLRTPAYEPLLTECRDTLICARLCALRCNCSGRRGGKGGANPFLLATGALGLVSLVLFWMYRSAHSHAGALNNSVKQLQSSVNQLHVSAHSEQVSDRQQALPLQLPSACSPGCCNARVLVRRSN